MSTKTLEKKEMHVIKRNNTEEIVSFDKILQRIKKIDNDATFNSTNVPLQIMYTSIAMKVIDQLYDHIATTQIDEFLQNNVL